MGPREEKDQSLIYGYFMLMFVFAFLLGDLWVQCSSQLPDAWIVLLVILSSAMVHRYSVIPLGIALGFGYACWFASMTLSWSVPKEIEGKPISITGYVASLPERDKDQTSFLFQTKDAMMKVSWTHQQPMIRVGDEWRLFVKLKRIHATQNPGAFDYEAYALQRGIRATAYVVNKGGVITRLSHSIFKFPLEQLRQYMQEKIEPLLPKTSSAPWLMALMMGERNSIAASDWQVLRNTGTNHLMAIAGLHIGILAGIVHFIVMWCWRKRPSLMLKMPAQHAGAIAALIAAMMYSALAGFSIPTQRACLMLAVFVTLLLLRKNTNPWQVWALALFIVLVLNPLCVLTDSFWLSFGTIALIIYGMSGRLMPTGWWWKWGRVQWVIGFGLIPLSLALFQECSVISFVANTIAIPWLAFLILPFCFLSDILIFISPTATALILFLADKSLAGLWCVLTWFSSWHFATWSMAMPSYFILGITVIGFIILLMPSGMPGRWFGMIWILPLLFFKPIKPAVGDYWLTLLDVGQGLSVIVQTNHHTLVYDTGFHYKNINMGESVVLPYLRLQRIRTLDKLIISHGDNDHIGGASALMASLHIRSIDTTVPEKLMSPVTQYCLAGNQWEWDGVRFQYLYPKNENLQLGNDSSCVLRIDNGKQSVLLTGDIEHYAEQQLLQSAAWRLKSDLLIAPHHGSKTSGLAGFIAAVQPQYVLYGIGYRNRYHFPHESVVKAYDEVNAMQFNTADSGMIFFDLAKVNVHPVLYRVQHHRYWWDGPHSAYTTY